MHINRPILRLLSLTNPRPSSLSHISLLFLSSPISKQDPVSSNVHVKLALPVTIYSFSATKTSNVTRPFLCCYRDTWQICDRTTSVLKYDIHSYAPNFLTILKCLNQKISQRISSILFMIKWMEPRKHILLVGAKTQQYSTEKDHSQNINVTSLQRTTV